jgi:hypothetical protein
LSETTFNKTNFWFIFSHFCNIKSELCEDCNSKFVEMHVDASDIYPSALVLLFYTRHRVNITIYQTVYLHTDMWLQTLTHIQLKNKLWTTVAFLRCCNLIWGLANNNYSLYFLQFLTISGNLRLCYIYFHSLLYCTPIYSWTIKQIDRHRSSAEDHTNISYYNLCGIGSQHSNISKGKGGWGYI